MSIQMRIGKLLPLTSRQEIPWEGVSQPSCQVHHSLLLVMQTQIQRDGSRCQLVWSNDTSSLLERLCTTPMVMLVSWSSSFTGPSLAAVMCQDTVNGVVLLSC